MASNGEILASFYPEGVLIAPTPWIHPDKLDRTHITYSQQFWQRYGGSSHPEVIALVEKHAESIMKMNNSAFISELCTLSQHLYKTVVLPEDVIKRASVLGSPTFQPRTLGDFVKTWGIDYSGSLEYWSRIYSAIQTWINEPCFAMLKYIKDIRTAPLTKHQEALLNQPDKDEVVVHVRKPTWVVGKQEARADAHALRARQRLEEKLAKEEARANRKLESLRYELRHAKMAAMIAEKDARIVYLEKQLAAASPVAPIPSLPPYNPTE